MEVGTELEVTELLVQEGSELAGRTLAESGLREHMGITVIGAWRRGDFVAALPPETPINEHTILLVAGRREGLKELKARTIATRKSKASHVVVVGYGVTGHTAAEALASEGFTVRVVDLREMEGVDVVGDITDEATLEAADVSNAQSILLTIDSDKTAIFATLVLKQMVPDLEIIVRANDPSNVVNLYRAGAEYVVALPTITGRMTASLLIEGEDVLTPASQFELVRTEAPGLVGQSLGDADVRAQTGCTIIAAERNGELMIDLGPDFVVGAQDKLIVAGSKQAIQQFLEWVS